LWGIREWYVNPHLYLSSVSHVPLHTPFDPVATTQVVKVGEEGHRVRRGVWVEGREEGGEKCT